MAALPRSRACRRQRPLWQWWLLVAIAVVVNLAIVLALGQISRFAHPAPPPPLALHRLHRAAPEPPPPAPEQLRESAASQVENIVPMALPSLALPSLSASPLILPALGNPTADVDLPMSIPAFAAVGPTIDAAVAPAAGLASGPLAFDTPAQRDGTFDLDRFYPRTARSRGITGTSRIRSHIDASGRVTAVDVLESRPPGVFDQAAERLGRAQRYRPAERAGTPLPTILDTTINWTIR